MRFRIVLLIAFVAIAIVATGVAWQHARLIRAASIARASLTDRRAQADIAATRATVRATAAQRRKTEVQATLEAQAKTSPAKVDPSAAKPPARAVTQAEVMASDAKVQTLALSEWRAEAANRYAMFFRIAGLSPTEIDRFLDSMEDRDAQNMDLRHTAESQGLAENDPVIGKLRTQLLTDYTAAQQKLLGPPGYKQLQDYEGAATLREVVGDYAGAATMAGLPFTTQQIDQLVQAFATSAGARPSRFVNPQKIDWVRLDAVVRTILSPAQFKFFTTTEPESISGRYGIQFRRATDAAKKADPQSATSQGTSGG